MGNCFSLKPVKSPVCSRCGESWGESDRWTATVEGACHKQCLVKAYKVQWKGPAEAKEDQGANRSSTVRAPTMPSPAPSVASSRCGGRVVPQQPAALPRSASLGCPAPAAAAPAASISCAASIASLETSVHRGSLAGFQQQQQQQQQYRTISRTNSIASCSTATADYWDTESSAYQGSRFYSGSTPPTPRGQLQQRQYPPISRSNSIVSCSTEPSMRSGTTFYSAPSGPQRPRRHGSALGTPDPSLHRIGRVKPPLYGSGSMIGILSVYGGRRNGDSMPIPFRQASASSRGSGGSAQPGSRRASRELEAAAPLSSSLNAWIGGYSTTGKLSFSGGRHH